MPPLFFYLPLNFNIYEERGLVEQRYPEPVQNWRGAILILKEIQKQGIEQILEAELDNHLDYGRHQKHLMAMPVIVIRPKRY